MSDIQNSKFVAIINNEEKIEKKGFEVKQFEMWTSQCHRDGSHIKIRHRVFRVGYGQIKDQKSKCKKFRVKIKDFVNVIVSDFHF